MQTQLAAEWTRRIERSSELQKQQPSAGQLLGFYHDILHLQSAIARDLPPDRFHPNPTFLEQVDLEIPLRHLPELLDLTRRRGTGVLAIAAEELRTLDARSLQGQMEALLRHEPEPMLETNRFFSLALLQPAAERVALNRPQAPTVDNRCPTCSSLPLLAVLRPEGDGSKRSLQCSLCLSEWSFRRVLCPWCGETDKDKLPRYTAEECDYVRIEACDTCKRYLKSIDLSIQGHAIPLVDEVAFAALDVWASEQGYTKVSENLLGF